MHNTAGKHETAPDPRHHQEGEEKTEGSARGTHRGERESGSRDGLLLLDAPDGRMADGVARIAIPVKGRSALPPARVETVRHHTLALPEHAAPPGLRVLPLHGVHGAVPEPAPHRRTEEENEDTQEKNRPAGNHGGNCSSEVNDCAISNLEITRPRLRPSNTLIRM